MSRIQDAILISVLFSACNTVVLDPPPVDLLTDDIVFTRPSDLPSVRIGLYAAARSLGSPTVQAGDFTADHIIHLGTFTDYREFGTKQITPANGVEATMCGEVFRTIYMSKFIMERIPQVSGIK